MKRNKDSLRDWSVCVYVYMCVHACTCAQLLSHVQLFVTSWTVVCQAPLSIGLSRQEYWSRLPFLLQEIFLTQGSNPHLLHLLHCQVGSLPLSHLGSPRDLWDNIKHTNIHIIGIPEEEEREKRPEKYLKI